MKLFFLTAILLVSCMAVRSQEVELSGGYQVTNLRWSIAGNNRNVLSEVKWRALSGPLLQGRLKFSPVRRVFAGAEVSKCFITSGSATDTDYGDNNRSLPTYQAELRSDEGSIWTCRIFGGFNFLLRKRLQLSAIAGYTANREALLLLNYTAPVPGQKHLRCTYQTSWKGLSGGVNGCYQVTSWMDVQAELQYSQMHYAAEADWNLIDAFQHPVSFKQRAKGFELRLNAATVFKLNQYLSLYIAGAYNHAATGTGTDELYLASGAVQTTRFNGAFANARKVLVGTRIAF
ncbi:hypothetical protein SAMN05444266_109225 [Chitinophaga jiangningensis]|uniref:Protochlamydia outer membrane protein domain-containing protein n=1 Tax=Chitinophaga jiangningensis TaxID=1419482 RepID=A0A1M7KAB1_9BACT|nr:hypothetical protein [Chitinophaga jiangningensis]SHM62232.1 hypothetical protein SAMN05444266_109225 [Chitinophaga jiangningensis]